MRGAEKAALEAYKCTVKETQRTLKDCDLQPIASLLGKSGVRNEAGGAYKRPSVGDLFGYFIYIACSHRDDEVTVVVAQ